MAEMVDQERFILERSLRLPVPGPGDFDRMEPRVADGFGNHWHGVILGDIPYAIIGNLSTQASSTFMHEQFSKSHSDCF